jgi:hypothetical protein
MNNLSRTLLLMTLTLIIAGCRADASVSLAKCFDVSFRELIDSNQGTITNRCDIGLQGDYVAVLHPAIMLDDEVYISHGLDHKAIKTLRSLRGAGAGYESIYIIPLNGQASPSRTTSQKSVVNVRKLIVARKSVSNLTFTLEWSPEGVMIVELK